MHFCCNASITSGITRMKGKEKMFAMWVYFLIMLWKWSKNALLAIYGSINGKKKKRKKVILNWCLKIQKKANTAGCCTCSWVSSSAFSLFLFLSLFIKLKFQNMFLLWCPKTKRGKKQMAWWINQLLNGIFKRKAK